MGRTQSTKLSASRGLPRDRKGRPLGRRGRITTAIRGDRRSSETIRLENEATRTVHLLEASAALRGARELLSRATCFLRLAGVEPTEREATSRASREIGRQLSGVSGAGESYECWRRSQHAFRESAADLWLRASAASGDALAVAAMNRGVALAKLSMRDDLLEPTSSIVKSMGRSLAAVRKKRLRTGGALGEIGRRLDEELSDLQLLSWMAAVTCVATCIPEVTSRYRDSDESEPQWSELIEARLLRIETAAERWAQARPTYGSEPSLRRHVARLDQAHVRLQEPIRIARHGKYREAVTAFDDVNEWICGQWEKSIDPRRADDAE